MANLVLTINLTEDNVPVPNFPIIARLNPSTAMPLDGVPVAVMCDSYEPVPQRTTMALVAPLTRPP